MNDERPPFSEELMGGEQGFVAPLVGNDEVGLETSKMGIGVEKGYKRKSPPPSVGAGGESDDDERPIGSLLKLRKPRATKKPRSLGLEARAENPRIEKGDPGEMNDTLAIFKKKLKGPKRVKDAGVRESVKDSSPLELEVKSQSKSSWHASTKKDEEKRVSGVLETSDHSSDVNLDDSLSALFQRSSTRRACSVSKKKLMERTPSTDGQLNQSLGTVANDRRSQLVERSCSLDGGFSSLSDGAPRVFRRRGRKPRSGPIVETKVAAVDDEGFGQTSHDENLGERLCVDDGFGSPSGKVPKGLVVKCRGRKLCASPIAEIKKVGVGVDEQLGLASHDEGLGLVVKRRGRKPRRDPVAELKDVGARFDEHSGRASHDGSLGLVVKQRGRKPRCDPVAEVEVGSGGDGHLGRISHDRSLGLVGKRWGRKPRRGPIAEMEEVDTPVDEHLDWASHDESLEERMCVDDGFSTPSDGGPKDLVFRHRGRKSRGDPTAEMEDVVAGVDEHSDRTSHDDNLEERLCFVVGKSRSSLVRKGRVGPANSVMGLSRNSSRSIEDSLSGLVQQSPPISALEVKSESARLDGGDGFRRFNEETLENSAPSAHEAFSPGSVLESKERVATNEEDGLRSSMEYGNNLNQTPNGASKDMLHHLAEEETHTLENGLKHCSNRNMSGLMHQVVESLTPAHVPTWSDDCAGFELCFEKLIKDIPQTAATSSAVKDVANEPSGGTCLLVQDSCSMQLLKMPEEPVRSGDMLDQSIDSVPRIKPSFLMQREEVTGSLDDDQLNELCKEKMNEDAVMSKACLNLTSEEALDKPSAHSENLSSISTNRLSENSKRFDEPLELSSENLESCPSSLDQDSQSLIPVQVEGIFHSDDVLNEQNDALSQSLPDCGKKEDVHNYSDDLNRFPTVDAISDKSPLTSARMQTEENLRSDDALPQSSSDNMSFMISQVPKDGIPQGLSLTDCGKKEEEDAHNSSDGLNQPPTDDPVSDKSPLTPVPMQTEGNLQSDDGLPQSSHEYLSVMTFQVVIDGLSHDLSLSDCGKKEKDAHNYSDDLNQQPMEDPLSDKTALTSVPIQTTENLRSDDGLLRSSSENLSVMTFRVAKDSLSHGSSLSGRGKMEKDVHNYSDGLNQPPIDDPISDKSPVTSVPMQTEDNLQCDDGLPQSPGEDLYVIRSQVVKQSALASTANCKVLPATGESLNQFVESEQVIIQSLEDASKVPSSVRSQDLVVVKDSDTACSPINILDLKETNPVDAAVVSDQENTDNQSMVPRAMRNIKKRKHGDMAYEGDVDWEVLMHEQGFLTNIAAVDGDQSARTKDKPEPLPHVLGDATNVGIAAVAAGLKACAAGPIEKIKFKELLKRKSALQEYLDCRNMILDLWSKDVNRILPLVDCGVSSVPSENESPRASLIREIYIFLDCTGYINAGIASEKEKPKPSGMPHSELSRESKPAETCGVKIASSKDEVASVFDEVGISENIAAIKNNISFEAQKTSMLTTEASESENLLVPSGGSEFSTQVKSGEHAIGNMEQNRQSVFTTCETQPFVGVSVGSDVCLDGKCNLRSGYCNHVKGDHVVECTDAQAQDDVATQNALSTDPSFEIFDRGINSAVSLKQIEASGVVHGSIGTERKMVAYIEKDGITARHSLEASYNTEFDLNVGKRIIVVGAGPAGLAAARHLQRQGFSVTVLEARDRIGGRVYTDRSSLSVPVDLGASIITGVEADVATERRPDPSSLICSQLGLELTVLNSDCPLYDVVTGHKVPADLDEALEAEYNSLLDDMVLFVAQNGENAMRMSLEDGLEYALRRRRMARSTSAALDSDQSKMASDYGIVDTKMSAFNGSDSGLATKLLSSLERRVMDWHFANLEYGCAAVLKEVSLPYWNQDDAYGGFGGAHCMIRGGYSTVVESLGEGLDIRLNHIVTEIMYNMKDSGTGQKQNNVKVSTSKGIEFVGDAVLITVPLGCLKANTIKFSPVLPEWKQSSIQRLGFGVLNKVVLEFPDVFWDDTVDYFGATAEETDLRGQCFMFWNVKKTVGAPVLIALVVGKAAIDGQSISTSDHVNHALVILRKLFGETSVPDPVAFVVTNWGIDPFSRGAYSYVALGASGEDYDILGKPVANCLFFAGEATCKEHPDTVGGAMMSGLREAVRIIDILTTGKDYVAEVEAMEAVQRHSDSERNELRDMSKRLEACKLSHVICKNSSDGMHTLITKEALLQDMFSNAKTTSGRLHLTKELLRFPVEALKSFAGTKEGLSTLNSWILDSLGKNATQLLRHCVRLLVLVSTDLLAVRFSGIGRTVKEKVCVHTSRDIRAIASQLVNMWIEVFRKEKAANGRLKLSRQTTASESSKIKSKDLVSGKPPLRMTNEASDGRGNLQIPPSAGSRSPSKANNKKTENKTTILESLLDTKSEVNSPLSQIQGLDSKVEDDIVMSEEEAAAFAAAEAARAAALAAAEAYASSEAEINALRELPKIPSFHKFVRREQYAQMDDSDLRRKWSGGILGRQDCLSEIDSRNCKVRNWSVDFTAACGNLDNSKMSGDNYSQRSYSNERACQLNHREHSGESGAIDSRLTKAWVDTDTAGSGGVKDSLAIDRWQSQAMDADADFFNRLYVRDEEDSDKMLKPSHVKKQTDDSSASQVAENKSSMEGQPRGSEHIKQGVVDYVASLLMPLYKTKKIDREGYKSIMKKTANKVMDLCTEAEKVMTVYEFLDFRRKNKIRSFVDKLIERHMTMNSNVKS